MMPFRRLPVLGTILPMFAADPGPSETPVAGFTATRFAAAHGFWLTEQPGTNRSGASLAFHLSGKKFDNCSRESYCGPLCTKRNPISSVSFLLTFQLS